MGVSGRPSLATLLEASFGVSTTFYTNRTLSTVGTAIVPLVQGDPLRVGLIIVNTSVGAIYVGPNSDVSQLKSINLPGSGSSISLVWDRDMELISQPWYVVGSALGLTLYTLEICIDPSTQKGV